VISLLLAHGGDPNLPDGRGCTPLHAAVELAAHPDCVRLLLESRADCMAQGFVTAPLLNDAPTDLAKPAPIKEQHQLTPYELLKLRSTDLAVEREALKLLEDWSDASRKSNLLNASILLNATHAWWEVSRCAALCRLGRADPKGRVGKLLLRLGCLPAQLVEVVLAKAWGVQELQWPTEAPALPKGAVAAIRGSSTDAGSLCKGNFWQHANRQLEHPQLQEMRTQLPGRAIERRALKPLPGATAAHDKAAIGVKACAAAPVEELLSKAPRRPLQLPGL